MQRQGWGVTWADYENSLEERLKDLHRRIHGGAHRAQPSRRQYIPKADGKLRPLGIAALEDKIVQRALGSSQTPSHQGRAEAADAPIDSRAGGSGCGRWSAGSLPIMP